MTKDDFLLNPNAYFYTDPTAIPPEWVAEAWDVHPSFRENVSYEFAREASKNGDLEMLTEGLQYLARVLRDDQAVQLYLNVRGGSPHREAEFRPDFERVFGARMAAFPPPLTKREVIEALGTESAQSLGISDEDAGPE